MRAPLLWWQPPPREAADSSPQRPHQFFRPGRRACRCAQNMDPGPRRACRHHPSRPVGSLWQMRFSSQAVLCVQVARPESHSCRSGHPCGACGSAGRGSLDPRPPDRPLIHEENVAPRQAQPKNAALPAGRSQRQTAPGAAGQAAGTGRLPLIHLLQGRMSEKTKASRAQTVSTCQMPPGPFRGPPAPGHGLGRFLREKRTARGAVRFICAQQISAATFSSGPWSRLSGWPP